jgi:hypothetical protein
MTTATPAQPGVTPDPQSLPDPGEDSGLRLFRNAVLLVPLAVLPGLWASPAHGLAAFLSSVVLLANFRALSILGPRLVMGSADPDGDPWLPLVGGGLVIKTGVLLLAFRLMLRHLPPEGVALGFLPILLGTLVTAFQLTRLEPPDLSQHRTSEA